MNGRVLNTAEEDKMMEDVDTTLPMDELTEVAEANYTASKG